MWAVYASVFIYTSFLFSGCSGAPTGEPHENFLRRSEVESLSLAMQNEVEKQIPLLEHKLVNRYVNAIGQSLVARNSQMPPLAYQFKVVRSNDLNAFSLPGGVVYVTLGMLSQIEFEGQFVAALAHELAHLDSGHALLRWRERIYKSKSPTQADREHSKLDFHSHYFGPGGLLTYGDAYEFEADEVAMVIIYQAGYDPRAYIAYLEELQRIQTKKPGLLKDLQSAHPPLNLRIQKANDYLKLLPPKRENRLTSSTFREIKQRLKIADKIKGKQKSSGEKDREEENDESKL